MKRRACIAVLCGVLGYSASVSAQQGPWGQGETGMPGASLTESLSEDATEVMLMKRVESVEWVDVTFEEVLDWLRDQGEDRVNIVPKWNHLGVEGISRDSLMTLQLNNTTVADVLNEALDQLSDTGELRYRGIRNKLTLSTRADFERRLHTRVYDCTDILFQVPNFGEDAPLIDLQQAGQAGGGGGSGGQSVFQGAGGQTQQVSGEQFEQELEERLTKLRELIEQSIAPESWDLSGGGQRGGQAQGAGGGRGRIRIFRRSLVVTNTIEIHEQIAGRFEFGG